MGQENDSHCQSNNPGNGHSSGSRNVRTPPRRNQSEPAHRSDLQRRPEPPDRYDSVDSRCTPRSGQRQRVHLLGDALGDRKGYAGVVLPRRGHRRGVPIPKEPEAARDGDARGTDTGTASCSGNYFGRRDGSAGSSNSVAGAGRRGGRNDRGSPGTEKRSLSMRLLLHLQLHLRLQFKLPLQWIRLNPRPLSSSPRNCPRLRAPTP